MNGATAPCGTGTFITRVSWAWGDREGSNSWFPAKHVYCESGNYDVTATAHQSDGETASANTQVSVSGTACPYAIGFAETGLPSGQPWSVVLGGIWVNSTSSTVAFPTEAGSFSYQVPDAGGYSAKPSSGTVEVSGSDVTVPVAFELARYGNLTITVDPGTGTQILVDGNVVASNTGSFTYENLAYGPHSIIAYNPFYLYNSTTVDVQSPQEAVSITLKPGTGVPGQYFPWVPIGPYRLLLQPPFMLPNGTGQVSSGHAGTMAIDFGNPQVMYIATGSSADPTYGPYGDGGIYKTVDGGRTWSPVDYGLPLDPVSSLLMNQSDPQELLAGLWSAGIYKTTDGGGYWYRVADYSSITGLTDVNGTVFAGTGHFLTGGSGSVVEGTGFGSAWSTVLSTMDGVTAISSSGTHLYAAAGSLWRSSDLGRSWTELPSPSKQVVEVAASLSNPLDLYALCGDAGFASGGVEANGTYYSSDGGGTFTQVPALNGIARVINFDPADSRIIWAQGSYSAAISFDGGAHWANGFPTPVGTPVGDLHNTYFVPTENGTIFALSDQGVFQSNDFGASWQSDNGNLFDYLVYGFGMSGDGTQIVASMQDYGGTQTHDGGNTWSFGNLSSAGVFEGDIVYTNPRNSSWVYAFAPGSQTLLESSDAGLNFHDSLDVPASNFPFGFNSLFGVSPSDPKTVYFGSAVGVYNGTGIGSTWSLWRGSPTGVLGLWVAPGGSVFVSTQSGLYRSAGSGWAKSAGAAFPVGSLTFDPQNPEIILLSSATNRNTAEIYQSTDGGLSFALESSDPFNFPFFPPPQMGYGGSPFTLMFLNTTGAPLVAGTPEGVFLSTNLGKSWSPINYNLLSGQVTSVAYANKNLYLSTYGEGIVEWKGFSLATLPATLNGVVSPPTASVEINGRPVPVYQGHFQQFLEPGNYSVLVSAQGNSRTYATSLGALQVYNLTATASPTTTTTLTSSTMASTASTTTSMSSTSTTLRQTSASTTSAASSTSTTTPGSGVPEFPFQLIAVTMFTSLLVVSYVLIRSGLGRRKEPAELSRSLVLLA